MTVKIKLKMEDKKRGLLLTSSLVMMIALDSQAYEFTKDFDLPSTVQYDTNVNMQRNNEVSAFRFITTPRLTLSSINEVNSFNLTGSLNIIRSTDRLNIIDREDPSLNASWSRLFEKGSFRLFGNYTRQSTRTSEFSGSGIIFNDGNSISKSINASLNYALNDRITTTLRASHNQNDFSLVAAGLSDFKTTSYGVNLAYLNNEKLTTFVDLGYVDFQSQAQSGSIKSQSVSVGFDYTYSPVLDFRASLGLNRNNPGDRGWIASTSVNYQIDDASDLIASWNRAISPTGLGGLQESDSLLFEYKKSISSYDQFGVDFLWTKNKTINLFESQSIGVFYSRELTPNWTARGSLSRRTIDSGISDARGHQIGFTIVYNILNF